MGKELASSSAAARRVFEEADEVLGFSLSSLCFEGPEDELALTANTQPAILTTSIAALAALEEAHPGIAPKLAMGHSLGEFSALVAVGALRFSDAVKLVHLRGRAMQEAVPSGQGAMAAILRVEATVVEELCASLAGDHVLAPANENGGGQIVVAGHADAVERLMESVSEAGGRAIPLKVSAPFHCSLMQPAAERLAEALSEIEIGDMAAPVIANVDAEPNNDKTRVKDLLIAQVTGRVRWEASVRTAAGLGVDAALELGHGAVLKGLVRRIEKGIRVTCLGTPEQIQGLNT
jgi:[acyl-carrier-protein] S-malonyltransferase